MTVKILFFGIVTDIVGKNSITFILDENSTVKDLKEALISNYFSLKNMSKHVISSVKH